MHSYLWDGWFERPRVGRKKENRRTAHRFEITICVKNMTQNSINTSEIKSPINPWPRPEKYWSEAHTSQITIHQRVFASLICAETKSDLVSWTELLKDMWNQVYTKSFTKAQWKSPVVRKPGNPMDYARKSRLIGSFRLTSVTRLCFKLDVSRGCPFQNLIGTPSKKETETIAFQGKEGCT